MLETVQIIVDGSPMNMLVGAPDDADRHPGILLSHHQHGLSRFTQFIAEGLVREGFVVVSPDHFHHSRDELDLATKKAALQDTRMIADMEAATDYLRKHPHVRPEAIAIMGHCMGGRGTLLGAATVADFRVGVVFYGGGVMVARGGGPTVFERLGGVKCPIAGFFGADDDSPSPGDVGKIEAKLKRSGVTCHFHIYEAAGHGFMDPYSGTQYREASARDAWPRAIAFLNTHLAEPARNQDAPRPSARRD